MAVSPKDVSSFTEHFDVVVVLAGLLGVGLLGALVYIFQGMRTEVREIKTTMKELSTELFRRVGETEKSIERLWGEHRGQHRNGGE